MNSAGHIATRTLRNGRGAMRALLAGSSIAAVLTGFVPSAYAQLEEIVVTARKRQENIQNIPVAITAITADALQKQNLTTLQAVAASTPDLQIVGGNSGSSATINIRGVGSSFTSIGVEQAVAVNVDGAYYGQGRVIQEALLDLNRVEILKGPQALFFGKNSSAGVVSLTTNNPGDHFEAIARVGYEVTQQELSGEAIVSGPINDKIAIRAAFRGSKAWDGYIQNDAKAGTYTTIDSATFAATVHPVGAPSQDYYPGERSLLGRLTVALKPTDDFKLTIKGMGDSDQRTSPSGNTKPLFCPTGSAQLNPTEQCNADWHEQQNPFPADLAASNPIAARNNGQLYEDYLSQGVNAQAEYSTRLVNYTMVANYQNVQNQWLGDYDFTGSPSVWATEKTKYEALSVEGRALTQFSGPVNVMGGFFYQQTTLDFNQDVFFLGSENSAAADPTTRYTSYRKKSQTDGHTYSAFGQVMWKFIPKWELTAGARFTHERKESFFVQPYVNPFLIGIFTQGSVISANQGFNNVSPEATLSYTPWSNVTLYVAYKYGFKSGGFSNSAIGSALPGFDASGLSFRPERVHGLEGGVKTTLFDNTLRLEFDAYTYKYENLQVDFFNSATFAYVTKNAASADQTGAELQAEYAPPEVKGLTLRGTIGYNKSNYLSFPDAPCYAGQTPAEGCTGNVNGLAVNNISGKPTALAPKWAASLGFDFDRPVFNGYKAGISLNARYSSSYSTNPFFNPTDVQKAYTNLDGALRFGAEDDRWELAIIGKNLTEQFVNYYGADLPLTGSGTGTAGGVHGDQSAIPNLPRTIQFLFTYKY